MIAFRLRRRVQFYETDAAGIVHFSWFFRYMEEAEHAMWREAGLSIHVPGGDVGWPRVAASFDFFRALRFEDEFDVDLAVAEVTTSTIRYDCALRKGEETMARGTMTIACVRKLPGGAMKATAIPGDILERLGQS